MVLEIILIVVLSLAVLFFLGLYIIFLITFYNGKRDVIDPDNLILPMGANFEAFRTQISTWIKENRKREFTVYKIKSFDNLTLSAKYYEYQKGAPIEIIFGGYRGNSERDLSAAVERCFKVGHSVLMVDQRASGDSGGKVISFAVNESKDCLAWIDFTLKTFGSNVKIVLGGVSLGGATVLSVADKDIKNVWYIIADCPFSSAEDIIKKVMKTDMKLPTKPLFPLVKLSAKIYGGFNLLEVSPKNAVKNAKIPVIFMHGDKDEFVPCKMSIDMYNLCPSHKALCIIESAEHGLAYPVNPDKYVNAILDFEKTI